MKKQNKKKGQLSGEKRKAARVQEIKRWDERGTKEERKSWREWIRLHSREMNCKGNESSRQVIWIERIALALKEL